jgi:type IV secretory pathway VirB4 component
MAKPLPKQILVPTKAKAAKSSTPVTENRVLLGENIYWELGRVSNPHIVIIGTSGSGKTQTVKAIASELKNNFPCQVIVLDFHGDQQLPDEFHAPFNMASPHGINPLVINIDPEGGGPKLQAIAVASNLRRSLTLGVNQEGLIITILDNLYQNHGIVQENQKSWLKVAPHFGHLQQAIQDRADGGCAESAKLQIKLAATFQYSVFSKPQVKLDGRKLVRIDLSKLPPELGSIASEALLKQLMDSHRLSGESDSLRTYMLVDEAKELKNSRMLDRISADGRKYGLAVGVASQREAHLSKDLLANTATKIVLPVDASDIAAVARRFRFDRGRVATLQKFQALVRFGNEAMTCQILPYYQRGQKQ